MNESVTSHPRAIEGEPLWVTYVREYILPSLVMCGMLYFLIFRVFLPMAELRRLMNQQGRNAETMEEQVGEHEKMITEGNSKKTEGEATSLVKEKKEN